MGTGGEGKVGEGGRGQGQGADGQQQARPKIEKDETGKDLEQLGFFYLKHLT